MRRRRRRGGDRSGPRFMGGIPERFPIFPPTISTIVGGICFVPQDTWHYPERPIRPHRGPHGPNGWIPDRLRLPGAGTQATPCVRRGTRVRLCADGTSGGPWLNVSNSSGDQRSRFAEMVLPGRRLRLPVKTTSVRRSREESISAWNKRMMSCVLRRWLLL